MRSELSLVGIDLSGDELLHPFNHEKHSLRDRFLQSKENN